MAGLFDKLKNTHRHEYSKQHLYSVQKTKPPPQKKTSFFLMIYQSQPSVIKTKGKQTCKNKTTKAKQQKQNNKNDFFFYLQVPVNIVKARLMKSHVPVASEQAPLMLDIKEEDCSVSNGSVQ